MTQDQKFRAILYCEVNNLKSPRQYILSLSADMKCWHASDYYTHTLHTCVHTCACDCLVYRSAEACNKPECFRPHLSHLCFVSLSLFYLRALLFLNKYLCLTANLSLFISACVCSAGMKRLHVLGKFVHVAALQRGA